MLGSGISWSQSNLWIKWNGHNAHPKLNYQNSCVLGIERHTRISKASNIGQMIKSSCIRGCGVSNTANTNHFQSCIVEVRMEILKIHPILFPFNFVAVKRNSVGAKSEANLCSSWDGVTPLSTHLVEAMSLNEFYDACIFVNIHNPKPLPWNISICASHC